MGRRPRDLAGQTFGLLTALEPTADRYHGDVVWLCRCTCGRVVRASSWNLRAHVKHSCGCQPPGPGKWWRCPPAKMARRLRQARALRASGLTLA
jgi:hypothetical protein